MNNEESGPEQRENGFIFNKRNVRFFEITGKTLVYPMLYQLYNFQKEIILTTLSNNTLIGLPSGLGKNLISAVITFNFHRWFLNGKIVVLSQTRSYLTDQVHAYGLYTSLSEKSFSELPANALEKDCEFACGRSILLTSPSKFLNCLNRNIFSLQNLVLLIVFENSKILKCAEYNEIINRTTNCLFRTIVLVDPPGFNSKIVKQVVEQFNISKIETGNMYSSEIKKYTYTAEIEPVEVEISPHIVNIKDAFYSVFEKYGKKLKDAKVITGNVASLTKTQIQKAKEKFLKSPPQNISKADRDDLVDSMTMCSFLCHGIELLHNWGIRAFYNYLFDDKKEDELKLLIVKDEHLTNQMKLLNEYLRTNGLKFDSAVARLLHPKLLNLKNLLTRYFSSGKDVDSLRIIVTCSIDDVIDDIDRLFRNLPPFVRYHCIKTKAKRFSDEEEYKEVIENLQAGVISVLVVSSLIEEIFEIKTSHVISLDPNKSLLRLSDARFQETTKKCIFILTKGTEYMKLEAMLNEKRNEQKPLDTSGVGQISYKSPSLFPLDFDPEFECTSVKETKSSLKNSPGQKTMLSYLKTNSSSLFNSHSKKNQKRGMDSPSIFADTLDFSSSVADMSVPIAQDAEFLFEGPVPYVPLVVNKRLSNSVMKNDDYDSFDELILDFPDNLYDCKNNNVKTPENKSILTSCENKSPTSARKKSWLKKSKEDSSCRTIDENKNKSKSVNISLAELPNESFVDDLFDDSSGSEAVNDNKVKKNQPNYFYVDDLFESSDSEMVDSDIKKNNHGCPTFVDALFEDSSDCEKPDFKTENNQSKLAKDNQNSDGIAEAKESATSPGCNQPEPTFNGEVDSDCDLFPPSPEAIPRNRLKISSMPWEALPNHFKINNVATDSLNKKAECKFNVLKQHSVIELDEDFFIDDEINSTSRSAKNGSKSSEPIKTSTSTDQTSGQEPTGKLVSPKHLDSVKENGEAHALDYSEIPSAILDDSTLESLTSEKCDLHCNEKTVPKASSPVLFSSGKSNRRRSLTNARGNQNTFMKFDLSFDFSEENLQRSEKLGSTDVARRASQKLTTAPSTHKSNSTIFDDNDDVFVTTKSLTRAGNGEIGIEDATKMSSSVQLNDSVTFPDDDFILNSIENARNVIPMKCSTPETAEMKTSTPIRIVEKYEKLNKTSTPVSGNRPRLVQRVRRSIPLFSESDVNIQLQSPEVSPQPLQPSREVRSVEPSPDVILKQRLFSNFKETIKRNYSMIKENKDENVSSKCSSVERKQSNGLNITDDDEDRFWLKKASFATDLINCFKKPSPVVKNESTDKYSSPINGHQRTPNRKKKKRIAKKRNLVEAFIDREAEVSDDADDDCSSGEDCSQLSDDSFIDDENATRTTNMSNYLKSLKSPKNVMGQFRIPFLSKSRLMINVCSQVDDHEQSYENDSFCVDEEESEPDTGYVPSILTQMEERLSKRKGKSTAKSKQFKRIKVIEESSPESPSIKKIERRRVKCFSSDSDD